MRDHSIMIWKLVSQFCLPEPRYKIVDIYIIFLSLVFGLGFRIITPPLVTI